MESNEPVVDEDGEFYFESDSLALKGNRDYMDLLKTIVILENQRTRAIEDMDELLAQRAIAVKDPLGFVNKLQNGELSNLPGDIKVAEIPYIDWSRYNISASDARLKPPQTRHGNFRTQPKVKQDDGRILVRGRPFDESKPETFNQPWTCAEQCKLEQLLIKYPDEEVSMRRWKKIASELGNRTAKQVMTRVQKYFLKLRAMNMPIPGQTPKLNPTTKKGMSRRNLHRNTSFFPSLHMIDDKDSDDRHQWMIRDTKNDQAQNNDEDTDLWQIELIKKIKSEKEQEPSSLQQHFGYKCICCDDDPLKGTRWNCVECFNVNLCSDCVVAQLEAVNPIHPPSHKLKAISATESSKNDDLDYSSYDYLNPNFLS
ncbi:ZZ-type zinc finger-containing protein 3 [Microplitis mediator]|uniref:ZZ-type zinc finger-containing protein 3 n=1 Tax=Microplitis mediator TaxID=375433 RepID=UPI0025567251|nr:ZZ-type zinc finger-containing protein 3 [Microplitis mediator]